MDFRLDKLLVMQAFGTRTQAQQLIRRGSVTVSGVPVRDPSLHVNPEEVLVNGQSISYREHYYLMMNKPAGVLTAARDPKQPTVMDLLPPLFHAREVMPVGRLDKDTTGLLLFTDNGAMAHFMLSPRRHVDKTYLARVDAPLTVEDIDAFARGLVLPDFTCESASLEILEDGCSGRLTIHEGKFHQVKRMFEARGKNVTRLHRETFGPLVLGDDLPEGKYRSLTDEEIALLRPYDISTENEK